ncbi:MAG: polysaccharide biosynthesis/export family protein [Chitinophagaceae bacterium]|nr:polysaccharide biosynthesis/export family protein [Chitinophagaceae bacterium]
MFRYLIFLFFIVAIYSCTPQQKLPVYLENVTDTTIVTNVEVIEPVIQKNDLLQIQVYSASVDPRVDAPYNLPMQTAATSGGGGGGFLVDANGNIEYPRIGTIQVEGLTKQQLADVIKSRLAGQLTDPVVIVRFQNYKVTILGEVSSQGSFSVPTEKLSILEAIGLAGGVSEFGKKTDIKILRESNGKRELGIIDITSENLFESPYYQLAQNDVVIVEPSNLKFRRQERQETTQRIAFTLSLITSVLFIYNTITR